MTEHNFKAMRKAMVESQLRTTAVNDPRVIEAMSAVARERFVPADQAALAYLDVRAPLSSTRALPAPMVVGRLLTELRTRPADRALVVGAGSGYSAAVLGLLVAEVVALEEDSGVAAIGQITGGNIASVSGPLVEGWRLAAPYDIILFDGAVEQVPEAIVDQLADGGRLAAPLVDRGVVRLSIGRKQGSAFGMTSVVEADCPHLPGFAPPPGFTF
jgi:protein-L-isoaspartate(D-aspartate) O-methyltransferase